MHKGRIIKKEDLLNEISSRTATLNLSYTKRGPNCEGCYNLVFETTCGHAYVSRKRCQPKGLVCAGSEILTVLIDGDTTLDLKRAHCLSCRRVYNNFQLMKPNARELTPKLMAARLRADAVKEQWQRKCIEANMPVYGLKRAQLDALAEEKRRSLQQSQQDTRVSFPNPINFDDRLRLLHDPNLEGEWVERARLILQNVQSISPTDKDDQHPDSPINDPSPAFVFRSPFLGETFDEGPEEVDTTAKQPASETKSS